MIIVYLGTFLLLMIIIAGTKKYKKNIRDRLEKREHKLLFLYGISMFILDRLPKKNIEKRSKKINSKFKALYISEDIEEITYWFRVKRLALCILILLIFAVFGFIASASEISKRSEDINSIERLNPGEGETSYSLNYKDESGYEIPVDIVLGERKMTEEEIYEMFNDVYDQVVKKLLGNNEDSGNVREKLELIDKYEIIDISWFIPEESSELINYNGEIIADFEESEAYPCYLEAHFEYDGIEEIFQIPILITKRSLTKEEEINSEVQNAIDNQNSEYKSEVNLPTELQGQKVSFTNLISADGNYYAVLGIIGIVLVIVMFEKNLDKKVKERNEQLMQDYPDMVSKLALLNEAGLNLLSAWIRIIADSEKNGISNRFLYQEMKFTYNKIKNGGTEGKEYVNFGKRCNLHSYIKLGNLLEQNLLKGNRGLSETLRLEAMDAYREKKRRVRKKGEEASTKLIFPMIINLGIIVVIIIVPAFQSMNI